MGFFASNLLLPDGRILRPSQITRSKAAAEALRDRLTEILARSTANEEDVRAKIVLPIVTEVLGYSYRHIDTEAPTKSRGRADVIVRLGNRTAVVVECKHPRQKVLSPRTKKKTVAQAERYAIELQADLVLVTNGTTFLLFQGRHLVYEAAKADDLIRRHVEFLTWLHPTPAYDRATGLVLPSGTITPEIHGIIRAARELKLPPDTELDLSSQSHAIGPELQARIAEEIEKYAAVQENLISMRNALADRFLFVVHLDETFCGYHTGAWEYDDAYCVNLQLEAQISTALDRAKEPVFLRLFLLINLDDVGRLADIIMPLGEHLLRSNHWIAFAEKRAFSDAGLRTGDLIGDSHILQYEDIGRFRYRLEKDTSRAKKMRNDIWDFLSLRRELTFSPAENERFRQYVREMVMRHVGK